MNIDIDGTKKIIAIDDGQGLNLTTQTNQVGLALAGISEKGPKGDTGSSGVVDVISGELVNLGTFTSALLGLPNLVDPNTYTKITVDAKGRVTAGANLSASDLPSHTHSGTDITTGTISSNRLPIGQIPGTVAAGDDGRLSNTRTPTAGSVIDASITSGGLSPLKITGTAVVTGDTRLSPAAQGTASVRAIAGDGTALTAAASDHSHTQIDNNLSMHGNISMHGNKVTNLGAATDPEDAVNKQYVDRVAVGLNVHNSVQVATNKINNVNSETYTITGSEPNGPFQVTSLYTTLETTNPKIDGVTLLSNGGVESGASRILIKDAPNNKANGIYYVTSTSGKIINVSRAADMTGTGITNWRSTTNGVVGAYIFVDSGATLNGSSWFANVTNVGTESIGTDPINFNKFASVNLTQGNGIDLSAGVISVKLATSNPGLDITNGLMVVANSTNPTITVASAGLSVNYSSTGGLQASASGLAIKPKSSGSGLTVDANGIYIDTGAITNAMLVGNIDLNSKVTGVLQTTNGGLGVNVATNQSGARSALGLGTAATLNTGTASGTVATGNHAHTFRTTQSFAIQGNIVTSSDLGVPTFFVTTGFVAPSGQTSQTQLVKIMYKIGGGTGTLPSVTFDIKSASFATVTSPSTWTGLTGFTGLIAVSTENRVVTPTAVTMMDTDQIALWVSGINGTPQNLSVTLVFEHKLNP